MTRQPPASVRRQLRREIGFGCPVDDCGNPYLYWHHFDPPWSEREHHEPDGMIALCAEHHAKADAGAFTVEQLRALKNERRDEPVSGKFDWLRNDLLVVVGGNLYYQTPVAVSLGAAPLIWTSRTPDGYLGLNLRMCGLSMRENFWQSPADAADIECPPNGKLIRSTNAKGDKIKVEFLVLADAAAVTQRYDVGDLAAGLRLPLTAVEITASVKDTKIDFGPKKTTLGKTQIAGSLVSHSRFGLVLGSTDF